MLDKLGFVWIFWFGVWFFFVLVNLIGVWLKIIFGYGGGGFLVLLIFMKMLVLGIFLFFFFDLVLVIDEIELDEVL